MEFTPPPPGLNGWLADAMYVIVAITATVVLFRMLKGQPANEQLEVSHNGLEERVKKLEAWQSELSAQLTQDKSEILLAGEQRASKLHTRIDAVLEGVSEQRGVIGGFKTALAELHQDIRNLKKS